MWTSLRSILKFIVAYLFVRVLSNSLWLLNPSVEEQNDFAIVTSIFIFKLIETGLSHLKNISIGCVYIPKMLF